jgi:hypothetical protein
MGYRVEKKPPKPEDLLPTYPVRNGATLYADFECYYVEPKMGHDPHTHDYLGWPDPHNTGDACQMLPPRDRFRWRYDGAIMKPDEPIPIILHSTDADIEDEGYSQECSVVFDQPDERILATAWVDEDIPNLIKMVISPQLPVFEDKPIEKRFTLFTHRTFERDSNTVLSDAAVRRSSSSSRVLRA